jgi:hypothetical protein
VGLNLDLQIIIPGQKTPVWRASTAISGSGDIEVGIEKTAKQIIKQLVKDGMME